MEDDLENISNDHRSIFYSAQLRIIDVSQNIRALGTRLSENEIKMSTTENSNIFYMLEKIFKEVSIPHIYNLIKNINQNYNSLIAILLEINYHLGQELLPKNKNKQSYRQQMDNNQLILPSSTNLLKDIRKKKLGGIHLFNQNYTRYLQDNRILETIKSERAMRVRKNRMEILRQSIFEELNHKTQVEENPAKNDQIANYILKTKDKNSIFNYVSYQPELQEILTFFQNSQNQANHFLGRKVAKINEQEGQFSFSDFQREIQLRNMNFKKEIISKFKQFILKFKKKEQQLQVYLGQRQAVFQKLQQKYFKRQEQAIQTDLNLDQCFKNHGNQLKQLQIKYHALQGMKRQQMNHSEKQGELVHQLALKDNQIEKLNRQILELESTVDYVKKLLRQEKIKKSGNGKEQLTQKSQKKITESGEIQKMAQIHVRQPTQHQGAHQQLSVNSVHQRKTSYLSNTWRRKQSNDNSSHLSFNDFERDGEPGTKPQKRKYVRYHIESKYTQSDTNNEGTSKKTLFRTTQCRQISVQTDKQKVEQTLTERMSDKLSNQQVLQKSKSKKSKNSPQSSPKNSFQNLDVKLNKTSSSQKLSQNQKKIQSKKSITSLQKIKSFEQQKDSSPLRSKTKKKTNNKKEEMKLDRLHFSKQQPQKQKNQINSLQQKKLNQQGEDLPKHLQKKDPKTYKIFQVVQQQGQQQNTMKNTSRSENISSIYSHKKLQCELIQKISKQLNRIKQQKNYSIHHLYDLTIFPFSRKQTTTTTSRQQNLKKDASSSTKAKEIPRSIALLDQIIKTKPENQIKQEKLKLWKQKLVNGLKSEVITEKQSEEIISVISESIKSQDIPIKEVIVSPITSLAANIRNSMPQINEETDNNSRKKKNLKCFRKSKLKTSCQESQQNIKMQEKSSQNNEMQQQIEDLILHESFNPYFKEKFMRLHQKCQQGSICSHINRYFETIMKYYQQKKKKGKQSIILPIEHIGNRIEVQQTQQKSIKKSPKNKQNKEAPFQRQNYSKMKMARQRYSQQIILPHIKEKVSIPTLKGFKNIN